MWLSWGMLLLPQCSNGVFCSIFRHTTCPLLKYDTLLSNKHVVDLDMQDKHDSDSGLIDVSESRGSSRGDKEWNPCLHSVEGETIYDFDWWAYFSPSGCRASILYPILVFQDLMNGCDMHHAWKYYWTHALYDRNSPLSSIGYGASRCRICASCAVFAGPEYKL